jgi:hypothetical protein
MPHHENEKFVLNSEQGWGDKSALLGRVRTATPPCITRCAPATSVMHFMASAIEGNNHALRNIYIIIRQMQERTIHLQL